MQSCFLMKDVRLRLRLRTQIQWPKSNLQRKTQWKRIQFQAWGHTTCAHNNRDEMCVCVCVYCVCVHRVARNNGKPQFGFICTSKSKSFGRKQLNVFRHLCHSLNASRFRLNKVFQWRATPLHLICCYSKKSETFSSLVAESGWLTVQFANLNWAK